MDEGRQRAIGHHPVLSTCSSRGRGKGPQEGPFSCHLLVIGTWVWNRSREPWQEDQTLQLNEIELLRVYSLDSLCDSRITKDVTWNWSLEWHHGCHSQWCKPLVLWRIMQFCKWKVLCCVRELRGGLAVASEGRVLTTILLQCEQKTLGRKQRPKRDLPFVLGWNRKNPMGKLQGLQGWSFARLASNFVCGRTLGNTFTTQCHTLYCWRGGRVFYLRFVSLLSSGGGKEPGSSLSCFGQWTHVLWKLGWKARAVIPVVLHLGGGAQTTYLRVRSHEGEFGLAWFEHIP